MDYQFFDLRLQRSNLLVSGLLPEVIQLGFQLLLAGNLLP